MEKGKVTKTTEGTSQGGIISPILANVYLHYVLDLWFEKLEQKIMRGYTQLVRYADEFMIGCQNRKKAEMILQSIKERLAKFGLSLSVDDTNHRIWTICEREQKKTKREEARHF